MFFESDASAAILVTEGAISSPSNFFGVADINVIDGWLLEGAAKI